MPELRAGAARANLQPHVGCHLQGSLTDRISNNLHDELYAKALVIDNGETRVGFVVCDLIVVIGGMTEKVKARVAEEVGIPPENLLVSATHTHYAPSIMDIALVPPETEFVERVPQQIADAVALAVQHLEPAQLGFAVGSVPTEVHNRRHYMRDGSVKMNPPATSPEIVKPAGPTDPALSVLVARATDRRPLGVLANLSLHYVGSAGLDISADYFGAFDRALQRCAGASFPAIMSNGCAGDINNINFFRPRPTAPDPYFHAERVANVCAGEAWKAWNTLWEEDYLDDVPLAGAIEWVDVHPRRPSAEQVAADTAYLNEHTVEEDPVRWMYCRERLKMQDFPDPVTVPIQAIRIGDLAFVGLPGEVFVEMGLAIKQRSPFQHTVPISLANDCAGYIATDQALDEGSYETELCRWVYVPQGTEGQWVDAAVGLLEQLA